MSSYPTDDPAGPRTPIFDQTVTARASHVEGHDSGSGTSAAANQAKDTAKQAAGQAKDQAQQVGSTAAQAGQRVASTTKDQASKVAGDAVGQARDLYGQATAQLSEQAGKQQKNAASALRTFGDDLSSMHQQHDGGGLAAELVQNVSARAGRVSEWLDSRDPGEVLDEVKQFAARRPGLFIGLAAVAGIVGARLTKALVADAKPDTAPTTPRASAPTTGRTFTDTEPYEDTDLPAAGAPYGSTGSSTAGASSFGSGLGDTR